MPTFANYARQSSSWLASTSVYSSKRRIPNPAVRTRLRRSRSRRQSHSPNPTHWQWTTRGTGKAGPTVRRTPAAELPIQGVGFGLGGASFSNGQQAGDEQAGLIGLLIDEPSMEVRPGREVISGVGADLLTSSCNWRAELRLPGVKGRTGPRRSEAGWCSRHFRRCLPRHGRSISHRHDGCEPSAAWRRCPVPFG